MIAPHANVVEYRVADACFPPDCKVSGRAAFGRSTDDPPGGYVAVGTDKDELFARRGLVLAPSKSITFTLPHVTDGETFDVSFATVAAGGGAFRASFEVRSGDAVLATRAFEGETSAFEATTELEKLGREEKYFLHVREPLPANAGETAITLRNDGAMPLGLGAPLVLRRVGRRARQAVLVFFDAVPHPVFDEMYRGTDPSTAWLARWAKNGTLFTDAISPGQLTGSFVRRFFRADYYRLDGDPSLVGQGFDETPPERAPGPVARLAEQGFFTEAIASNLYLSPILSRIGFDADYNVESTIELQIHPQALASRFAREIEIHRDDDALFVLWFANTHAPWREGRKGAALRLPGGNDELDMDVLDPIWKNLLDAVDALRRVVESADERAGADRIWMIGADHGHTFTLASRARPWRLTREAVEDHHMHCCLATAEEARTFLAILPDRGSAASRGRTVGEPVSTLAMWSEIETRFGVDLGLPQTSAFALPGRAADHFDDGLFVSVGNSGSLFARHGDLSYRAYEPAPRLAPAWELGPRMSRLLFGSPEPVDGILSEELYDVARDPRETNDLASSRFADLLDMRRRTTDWLAEYADGPDHARYRYHLVFGRAVEIAIRAPRAFTLQVDGGPAAASAPAARVSGASFAFEDGERPLGVVDLAGDAVDLGVTVRCASSGLPLAVLDAGHPRLDFALARTNCVGSSADRRPAAGEVLFDAEPVARAGGAKGPSKDAAVPELRRALQRWGYVREK